MAFYSIIYMICQNIKHTKMDRFSHKCVACDKPLGNASNVIHYTRHECCLRMLIVHEACDGKIKTLLECDRCISCGTSISNHRSLQQASIFIGALLAIFIIFVFSLKEILLIIMLPVVIIVVSICFMAYEVHQEHKRAWWIEEQRELHQK